MKNKTFEPKPDTRTSLSPYQAEPAEAQQTPVLRSGPLGGILVPPGSEATLRAHAAGLTPATAGPALRQLQRQYGNRYVQRVVELVQRRGSGEGASTSLSTGFQLDDETAGRINRARGSGQPLDGAVQVHMSEVLGHDFSGVRVHTDPEAHTLNRLLNARAFTTGPDIFFRRGEYNPGSGSGRELIAHELSHVVQQGKGRVPGGGSSSGMTVRPAGDACEQEAQAMAVRGMRASRIGSWPQAVASPDLARPADILAIPGGYGNQALQAILAKHQLVSAGTAPRGMEMHRTHRRAIGGREGANAARDSRIRKERVAAGATERGQGGTRAAEHRLTEFSLPPHELVHGRAQAERQVRRKQNKQAQPRSVPIDLGEIANRAGDVGAIRPGRRSSPGMMRKSLAVGLGLCKDDERRRGSRARTGQAVKGTVAEGASRTTGTPVQRFVLRIDPDAQFVYAMQAMAARYFPGEDFYERGHDEGHIPLATHAQERLILLGHGIHSWIQSVRRWLGLPIRRIWWFGGLNASQLASYLIEQGLQPEHQQIDLAGCSSAVGGDASFAARLRRRLIDDHHVQEALVVRGTQGPSITIPEGVTVLEHLLEEHEEATPAQWDQPEWQLQIWHTFEQHGG